MMEASKATKRRCAEASSGVFDWDEVFKGDGIDVGSGTDPLPGAIPFNLPDGTEDNLTKFFPFTKFDYVHASNVLEHAIDPKVMLQSWIDCLKPGGYIVATVPDYELYEKKTWPSKWNAGHQSIWTMDKKTFDGPLPVTALAIKLPDWIETYFPMVEILLCRLIDTSDHSLPDSVDQTFPEDGAEVFIEMVLRKR